MKKFLLILILPLFCLLADLFIRAELLAFFKPKQVGFYLLSLTASFSFFVFAQVLFSSLNQSKKIVFVLMSLFSLYCIVAIAASYAFYYFNGYFPNYYTLEYFRTEPKSALILLKDSINIFDIILFSSCFFLLFFFLRFIASRIHFGKPFRFLLLTGLIYLSLITVLTLNHKKYDQCYTVESNFSASLFRHLFEIKKERKFEGRGLGYRQPVRLQQIEKKNKFNVIVVVFESLRKQNLGAYNYERQTTPELDKFQVAHSKEFFVFQNPYAVSTTTMLAVPGVLTGIAPYQDPSVFYSQPIIWDYGKMAGMRSFFLSSHTLEWYHFDRFYAHEKIDKLWCKDNSGFEFYNDLGIDDKHTISQLKKEMRGQTPYFGVIQLNTTHYPYNVPVDFQKWKGTFTDEYDNAILYQDHVIGEFLNQLKKSGQLSNTVVVFTSDHGESLKDHNLIGHVDSYYLETISVPLMMYIPKHLQSNFNIHQLKKNLKKTVSNIDIAPTIIDVLGLRKNKQIGPLLTNYTGYSLLKSIPQERAIITMNNNEVARFKVGISIVKNGWHYLHKMNNVPHREELYFLKKDKKEKQNLIQWGRKKHLLQIMNELKKYPICSDYLPKIE